MKMRLMCSPWYLKRVKAVKDYVKRIAKESSSYITRSILDGVVYGRFKLDYSMPLKVVDAAEIQFGGTINRGLSRRTCQGFWEQS